MGNKTRQTAIVHPRSGKPRARGRESAAGRRGRDAEVGRHVPVVGDVRRVRNVVMEEVEHRKREGGGGLGGTWGRWSPPRRAWQRHEARRSEKPLEHHSLPDSRWRIACELPEHTGTTLGVRPRRSPKVPRSDPKVPKLLDCQTAGFLGAIASRQTAWSWRLGVLGIG